MTPSLRLVFALPVLATSVVLADDEAQRLQARIQMLEQKVAELGGTNWMTEQRADEIRALVHDVLADADTRASLLSSSMTAGYDGGFTIGSGDGNFNLRLNGQMQSRWIYNMQDGASVDENRWGFDLPRTKLRLSGNIFGQEWGYYIQGNFNNSGGSFGLEDAIISHPLNDNWTFMMGQGKVPTLREFGVSTRDLLVMELSNAVLQSPAASRTKMAGLDYRDDQFHAVIAVSDGAGQANTPWNTFDTEYSFSGRAEFLLSGSWDQFSTFTSPRGSDQGLMIGVGAHWQDGEYGTAAGETEVLVATADVSAEYDGMSLFASVIYNSTDTGTGPDVDAYSIVVQGGYYLSDDWELYGRYEWHDFDTTADELSILTVGVNNYLNDNVKWTSDIGFGFDQVSGANTITGFRNDAAGEDGQVVLRTQLQLLF